MRSAHPSLIFSASTPGASAKDLTVYEEHKLEIWISQDASRVGGSFLSLFFGLHRLPARKNTAQVKLLRHEMNYRLYSWKIQKQLVQIFIGHFPEVECEVECIVFVLPKHLRNPPLLVPSSKFPQQPAVVSAVSNHTSRVKAATKNYIYCIHDTRFGFRLPYRDQVVSLLHC